MTSKKILTVLFLLTTSTLYSQDTLYFKLSNPWNTVKTPSGKYIRKCIKENDFYHIWDYNERNILVTESFYTDTNFTRKLFCHKYFDENKGFLKQTRCYENGRLHGYAVSYDENGDTTDYSIYDNSTIIKSWSSKPEKETSIITFNEEPAEFPGGRQAWLEYIARNLVYPQALQSIKGKVVVKFIVNPKGWVEAIEVVESLHPLLDKEAINVINKSPKWKPAKQNGKKVPTTITQPITFK